MLRKDGKIELLKQVPLFSHCTKKELAAVANLADLVDIPAGTVLIREGAIGRECMVVVEGEVEVRRKGRKINTLGPGDFIGEMALISGAPRNATVTTTRDSSLLAVTDRQFWELLERTPSMQMSVIRALGERLQSLNA
jgi:CRP/FNR family transcriptional regulator, cyclic AMP receptor protein